MFHAYESSEYVDRMDVLRALVDQPGLHYYPFVEIPLNTHLFHLDVAPVAQESRWQRFVFDKLENVFKFSDQEEIDKFRVYVQTRREVDADYQLRRVVEISKGRAPSGEAAYVLICANGTIEVSGFDDLSPDDITCQSKVWVEPEITQ